MFSGFHGMLRKLVLGRAGQAKELRKEAMTDPGDVRRCAYCGKDRPLQETRGPLGMGGVMICGPCARSRIAIRA
jgi:hypothetical protein